MFVVVTVMITYQLTSCKMQHILWCGFILLCRLVAFCNGTIPNYIHVCKSDDPNLSNCIINSINMLQPKLKTGIPELDVPPLEPLELDEIKLRKGLQANITNLKVWGPSNFKIMELIPNVPKNRFAFIVALPYLHFEAKYELNTRILLMNIKGKGPIQGNFTDYGFTGVLKGNRIQQNGEEHLKFENMKLDIHFGHSEIKLENLFNGNPTLGSAVNAVINDNNADILNVIRPSLEAALADKFTEIANKITLRFSHKELFL